MLSWPQFNYSIEHVRIIHKTHTNRMFAHRLTPSHIAQCSLILCSVIQSLCIPRKSNTLEGTAHMIYCYCLEDMNTVHTLRKHDEPFFPRTACQCNSCIREAPTAVDDAGYRHRWFWIPPSMILDTAMDDSGCRRRWFWMPPSMILDTAMDDCGYRFRWYRIPPSMILDTAIDDTGYRHRWSWIPPSTMLDTAIDDVGYRHLRFWIPLSMILDTAIDDSGYRLLWFWIPPFNYIATHWKTIENLLFFLGFLKYLQHNK